MGSKANKEEMKNCLRDANLYEENLSDEVIEEYYKAIKNSETSLREESLIELHLNDTNEQSLNDSANELIEAINNSESIAPSKSKSRVSVSDDDNSFDFNEDILDKSKSTKGEPNNNNNNSILDGKFEKSARPFERAQDVAKISIGFNDMCKSGPNRLKIVTHELKFVNVANSKKFLTSSSEVRIRMLYDYHEAAARLMAHYASFSTNMAPMGKPVTTIDHDLWVNPTISTLKDEDSQQSTETSYVSRSGRLTKRKVYTDMEDSNDDEGFSSPKKSKNNNEEWLVKASTKETQKPKSKNDSKIPKCKNGPSESASNNNISAAAGSSRSGTRTKRNDSPDSSSQDTRVTMMEYLDEFDEVKAETPVQSKPRTYQRRLTNDEIMDRCSLFKDNLKGGRAAECVSAALESAEKRKKREEEINKFTNSLNTEDSQDLDDDFDRIVVDDEVDIKRRIVPPIPFSRKTINAKKRGGLEPLNITAKRPHLNSTVSSERESPQVNGIKRKSLQKKGVAPSEPSSSGVGKPKKNLNMTPCPLCSVSFPQKEIEEHAATCGEETFPQTTQHKRITCEICDTVVSFNTDYEVHVKECIGKRNAGGLG